jgi:1,4-alpha-glucan branching enzyme
MKKWIWILIAAMITGGSCKKDNAPEEEIPIDSADVVIPFNNVPATEDVVMYEIHPWAFSSSKNFQGITDRLDSVKALGINTIWLMPVYAIGIVNSFGRPTV